MRVRGVPAVAVELKVAHVDMEGELWMDETASRRQVGSCVYRGEGKTMTSM
jgi:hypothetical protein